MRSILPLAAVVAVLVSMTGAVAQSADDAAAIDELVRQGQPIYEENCRVCHAASGGGYIGPSLIGNRHLADPVHVFSQVSNGGDEMPALGSKLTDDEVLAVGTYVRNSWGNDYGILTEDNVVRD